jgi:hypothetical protein
MSKNQQKSAFLLEKIEKTLKNCQLAEITRAEKEGVKLPTVAEELTKYITNPDKPEYYMQFSYVNKLGINPSSKYNTPVGIYSYPITEYSLRSLMAGQIPFASDRTYIIVFKLRNDEGVVFNPDPGMGHAGAIPVDGFTGGLTRDEYFDFVKEIYSDDFVNNYSRKHMGKTFRSPMSWLRGAQRDVNVAKEGRITVSNKKMLRDIIVKVATKNYPPLQAKIDVSMWYKYVVNDYILEMLRPPFGKASRQRAAASPGDWASKMYAYTDSKRPSFGGKAERALKEAFTQLKEELIDKYIIRPETLEHRFSSAGPIFNQDPEQPWNSAPDWFMDIAVSDAFKDAAASAKQPHYLGILWNLTREAAHEDPIVWSSMLRKLGIAGVVDANKGSVIHAAEPTQAVFFSRGDLELVEVFQNELSPYKVRQREVSEMLPVFHRAFIEKWGRKPSVQEREKFAYIAQARGFTSHNQEVSFAEEQAQKIGEDPDKVYNPDDDHIDLSKHTL